jgi:antitoxin VapB
MALSIKHPEADQLARTLANLTGETLTDAVLNALRERLQRITGMKRDRDLRDQVSQIQARVAALPLLDTRSDDELLGYTASGIPS